MSVSTSARGTSAVLRLSVCIGLSLALGACNDAALELAAAPRASGGGATVAIEALEGAPDGLRERFAAALIDVAPSRQVRLVGATDAPRFRVKGYLTAYQAADGRTAVAFVWDVFDADKRRAQRVTGEAAARGGSGDPWSAFDERALRAVAAASMDGIAGVVGGATAIASRPGATTPLGYAPLN